VGRRCPIAKGVTFGVACRLLPSLRGSLDAFRSLGGFAGRRGGCVSPEDCSLGVAAARLDPPEGAYAEAALRGDEGGAYRGRSRAGVAVEVGGGAAGRAAHANVMDADFCGDWRRWV